MANEEHLKILKQGVKVWNKWREENPDTKPNLKRAHLRGIDLTTANISSTDLSEVDLGKANLSGVYLQGADLTAANLSIVDANRQQICVAL